MSAVYLIAGPQADLVRAMWERTPPTAAELAAMPTAAKGDAPVVGKDGVARIGVRGVLTKTPDANLEWWGIENTAYTGIIAQIEEAKSRRASAIELHVDSGGGSVDGLYEAMDAIRTSGIPTTAHVEGMAASAAYSLASQASRIEAENPLSLVGSVGVATSVFMNPYSKEIANRASADKRPDVSTPEGVAVVQNELDDIFNILAERIADGRKTSVDTIMTSYGHGATMTARTALAAGMIDGIKSENHAGTPAKTTPQGGAKMDRATLKAEHPDLFAAVMAEGIEAGKSACLDVVAGHLELASASGDMDRAVADIRAMNPVTPAVMAHHTAAGIRRAGVEARQAEAPAPVAAVAGGTPVESLEKDKAEINALVPGVKVEW